MSLDYIFETTSHFETIEFEWIINNYSKLSDQVEGPTFAPFPGHNFRFKAGLKFISYPSDAMSVYLVSCPLDDLNEESSMPLRVKGEISFRNSEGKQWKDTKCNVIVKAGQSVECWNLADISPEFSSSVEDDFKLNDDDVLILKWSITVSGIITSIRTHKSEIPVIKKDDEAFGKLLEKIYEKKAYTDFTFYLGSQKITSHKAVLSARSAVFDNMFRHDTLEKKTSSINIEDFEYPIFDCFIRFVYTKEIKRELKNDLNSVLSLYDVADKYEVFDLQRYCADILLCRFLNVNDVLRIFVAADTHSDNYLKEPALKFIHSRYFEVKETSEWSDFVKNYESLALQI